MTWCTVRGGKITVDLMTLSCVSNGNGNSLLPNMGYESGVIANANLH